MVARLTEWISVCLPVLSGQRRWLQMVETETTKPDETRRGAGEAKKWVLSSPRGEIGAASSAAYCAVLLAEVDWCLTHRGIEISVSYSPLKKIGKEHFVED